MPEVGKTLLCALQASEEIDCQLRWCPTANVRIQLVEALLPSMYQHAGNVRTRGGQGFKFSLDSIEVRKEVYFINPIWRNISY